MAYPLTTFMNYLSIKKLSETYKKQLGYCFMTFNTNYGGFFQESVNDFLLKHNNQTIPKAFINMLKEFLLYNKEELLITPEEHTRILEVKVPKITGRKIRKLIVPLSKDDIKLLEEHLETEEQKLMLLIAYYGALRLQELMRIKLNSFNWKMAGSNPGEMVEVKVFGKGNKEGIAFLPYDLALRINRFLHSKVFKHGEEAFLFRYTGRNFEIKLKEAGIKAGLTRKNPDGEWIKETITNPHRLRHSRATHLLKENVNLFQIQETLRHTSITSTQIYAHVDKEDLKKVLKDVSN